MVQRLRDICTFEQISVLDISENSYDSSSMMFVAESMTNDLGEYGEALLKSVRCVRPGGSFAVALMLNSHGYNAGDATFPAVPVKPQEIKALIDPEASEVEYSEISFNVREGHEGMLLVTGHHKRPSILKRHDSSATAVTSLERSLRIPVKTRRRKSAAAP